MSATSPDWADTSVRWLRTNHPELVPWRRSYVDVLDMALWTMNYLRFERMDQGAWPRDQWRLSLKEMAHHWTKQDHDRMVGFLQSGGYAALKVLGGITEGELAELVVAPTEPFTVTNIDGTTEEIMIEMPPAPLSSEAELEELITAAAQNEDPRVGSW